LQFEGNELALNFTTSEGGIVRIGIEDESGSPIDGFGIDECVPLHGDSIAEVVAWKGGDDVGALAGRPVRLRFGLEAADLYSFVFR